MIDLRSTHPDEPSYPFLLLTYLICADEQIHIEEWRNLRVLAAKLEIEGRTREEMEKILSQGEDRLALDDIIRSVPKQDRERALRLLVSMAYVDGFCDWPERRFLEEVVKRWQAPRETLDQLCSQAEYPVRQREKNQERIEDREKPPLVVRIFHILDALFPPKLVDAITKVTPQGARRWLESMRRKSLLAGHDYTEAIKVCTQVAHEDIALAEEAVERAWTTLDRLG
jgi:uncharacterized tellurite resistance protein B-like protein